MISNRVLYKSTPKKRAVRNSDKVRKDVVVNPVQLQESIKQNEKLKNLLGERELGGT